MSDFKTLLQQQKFLISDGGWGTEFAKLGLPPGEAPEHWNIERPKDVQSIAQAYVNAGSDIIITNSFGGNTFKLKKSHILDQAEEINRLAAQISKNAAADKALVFASIGPTGEFMEPLGTVSEAEMIAAFVPQIKGFVAGGADGIVIETFTDLAEAKAALKAAKDNCDLPVVVSLTFDKGARGYATMMGITPAQAAQEFTAAGADSVGSNCGAGIENMIEVAKLMSPATDLPLWFKANAGLPELIDGQTVFRQTPEVMVSHLNELLDAGANIIGGCCGTSPDHIRAIAQARQAMA
ncbi:MAG: homocysteine S-methyltransferase family protein [Sedimentisphaerales bacterium]|nr:homocysteine S-methyltransferase family protein [Sedimentisphaerales bacterium]